MAVNSEADELRRQLNHLQEKSEVDEALKASSLRRITVLEVSYNSIKELKKNLEEVNTKQSESIVNLQKDNRTKDKTIKDFTDSLSLKEKELSETRAVLEEYKISGLKTSDNEAALKLEISRVENQMNSHISKNTELQAEVERLQAVNTDLSENLVNSETEITKLKSEISESMSKILSLEEEKIKVEAEAKSLQTRVQEANAKIEEMDAFTRKHAIIPPPHREGNCMY